MTTVTIKPPSLHKTQAEVRKHPARFKVLACGRRWGKTRLGSLLCIEIALKGGRAWWVAPSYKVARVGWRLITRLASQIPQTEIRKGDMLINFPTGGEVAVRSADNPDALRGEGLNLVVMDECAFVKEAAWTEALRPALSDRLGSAVFISTPKGRNWFWRLFQRGQDEAYSDYMSWQLPTLDNPYIDAGEVAAAKETLPERIYQQEYLATFLDDAGGVFRGVAECATAVWQDKPKQGHQYAIGVDWGREHDFTVLTVLDVTTRELVHLDRFTQIDYNIQSSRLKALARKFRPFRIIAEYNSMGGPIVERLQADGLPVEGFQTTNKSKEAAIRSLEAAFENREIQILPDDVLIGELQAYEQTRMATGWRFSAPEGMHDDTVMSLALAWQAVAEETWLAW